MSQPRRRRRRRRRGGPRPDAPGPADQTPRASDDTAQRASRGRRRRRGRGGSRARTPGPRTLEEVEQAIKGPMPAELAAPPDGQTLEGIIGDLQSRWGVPQYPQEYRITIKVAEEPKASPAPPASDNGGVTREKAPAAPRVGPSASETGVKREKAPRRKRRSRRGRKRR